MPPRVRLSPVAPTKLPSPKFKLQQCPPPAALAQIAAGARGREKWKQIRRFPLYEVSDQGNVRRALPVGRTYCFPGVMKLKVGRHGYVEAQLYDGARQINKGVHTLVAAAFCTRRTGKSMACHIDGNKLNNRASNLYWGDAADNASDRMRHDRKARMIQYKRQHRAKSGQRVGAVAGYSR